MTTTSPPTPTTGTTHPAEPPSTTAPTLSPRLAGVGGLAFVVIVVAQNVLRGASAPANDAAIEVITRHYADSHALESVLAGSFAISALALVLYLGGLLARITTGAGQPWAFVGLVGAAGIVALFSTVVALEIALATAAGRPSPTPGTIETLWTLHNSVFSVLDASIAAGLLGLGLASVRAGLAPAAFRWLAPLGAGLLLVGAAAAPVIVDGSGMAMMGFAGIGFLIWLAFVAISGFRLTRVALV